MIDTAFCELLEYKITEALQHSPDERIRTCWCDGVLLPVFEHEYSRQHVNDSKRITLTAFIGTDGQDKYEVVLLFGKKTLSRYARDLGVSACIPEVEAIEAFVFDNLRKQIIIELL